MSNSILKTLFIFSMIILGNFSGQASAEEALSDIATSWSSQDTVDTTSADDGTTYPDDSGPADSADIQAELEKEKTNY